MHLIVNANMSFVAGQMGVRLCESFEETLDICDYIQAID